MKYLLDSNILIYAIRKDGKAIQWMIDPGSIISVLTRHELQIGTHPEDMMQVMQIFQHIESIPVTDEVVDRAAKLINQRPSLKRKYPDVLIAATCIVHNYQLVTGNVKDFKGIPDLSLISFEVDDHP